MFIDLFDHFVDLSKNVRDKNLFGYWIFKQRTVYVLRIIILTTIVT